MAIAAAQRHPTADFPDWIRNQPYGSSARRFLDAQLRAYSARAFAPSPVRSAAISSFTTSAALPGTAHYLPPSAPVPVGETSSGGAVVSAVIHAAGGGLPQMGVSTPDFENEGQPPLIFSPAPIILPGQVDPGREEHEEGENDVAHTITHFVQQGIGAIFGGDESINFTNPGPIGFAPGATVAGPAQGGIGVPGGGGVQVAAGGCPPRKTRTLTIDCATGIEVKRKRRRRRALLTQGDMGVLFQIASLPNNANVKVALAGAIRR